MYRPMFDWANGIDPYFRIILSVIAPNDKEANKIHKVLCEGNFVLVVSEGLLGANGGIPTAFYELFRIGDGEVIKHWDVVEAIHEEVDRKNTNDKFNFKTNVTKNESDP
ncbi:MAG: hypothetical protein R3Y26_06265 [Rikenellaceae bacterium]